MRYTALASMLQLAREVPVRAPCGPCNFLALSHPGTLMLLLFRISFNRFELFPIQAHAEV